MPASVRRHNLVRLREELNLTQADLGQRVNRAAATIKSVETNRLALSPRLATLIAEVTGVDVGWLLRNDLGEPMPPLRRTSAKLDPLAPEQAYSKTLILLLHLFHRLFAALVRLKKTQARTAVENLLQLTLDNVKKIDQDPACEHGDDIQANIFEFFKAHPEFLDPDLAGWINLDYLIQDAYRVSKEIKVYYRRLAAEARLAEEPPKPRHHSAPGRNPGSPSPAGQHRKRKSS
jgi:transcriptional regulator with XRE-family HTH domain